MPAVVDMAEATARQVADYIVSFLTEHGDPITNLKLQKLLYYAQGWYLATYDVPMFDEPIEAWVHGPVVPSVYDDFKPCGWQPIPKPDAEVRLSERPAFMVNEVIEVYGGMGAYDLERLTHQEDPWLKARAGLPLDEPSRAIISHDSMKEFFRARFVAEREA
jgi:uncharacterized phage-associated protein